MKLIGTLVVVAALAAAAFTVFIYSGWYNIAASEPHTPATRAVLRTLMKNSVEAHARDVQPPALSSPQMIKAGAAHYAEYCVVCHGAPDVKRSEIGQGLTPRPPELSKAAIEWTPAELFWITKHGIKMTGMPAWGASHSDDELWHVVAFVMQMPHMSAQQYKKLTAEAEGGQH